LLGTIEALYPKRLGKNSGQHRAHPAARIFQALRVAVNDEMTVLERALTGCAHALGSGGVLAVITFQPLEERMVKQIFRSLAVEPLDNIGRVVGVAPFTMGKKVVPSEAELALNPRARSAILRTLKKA
jgi:16S rRNA (cytosine1402-N4)-methyltransferase